MTPEPIRGLSRFRERFAAHAESYVLIGGAASLLAMEEAGLTFRATKDLDLVLCVEALDKRFFQAFWEFVRDGGYAVREAGERPRRYYRFHKPTDVTYPEMIELFSRTPDGLRLPPSAHLTPIPSNADALSLSAILLEDTYYEWVLAGRRTVEGMQLIGPEHLIPLKARAHLDLAERRRKGEKVDLGAVKKHQRDVARLAGLLLPAPLDTHVPDRVRDDVRRFVTSFDLTPETLKQIGAAIQEPAALVDHLRVVYGL